MYVMNLRSRHVASALTFLILLSLQGTFLKAQPLSPVHTWLNGLIAAEDTIQFRMSRSILNDSTIFLFEIGQFELCAGTGAAPRFIGFAYDSTGINPPSLFKTASFTTLSSHDTLKLRRFVAFDDRTILQSDLTSAMDSNDLKTTVSSWASSMASKFVIPDTAYFNTNSRVRYILRVKSDSNDLAIASPDTLFCWINKTTHHLFYGSTGNSPAFRTLVMPLDSGAHVHLDVDMVQVSLPDSALFLTLGYAMNQQHARYDSRYPGFHRIPNSGTLPLPHLSVTPLTKPSNLDLDVVELAGRSNVFELKINSPTAGKGICELLDCVGAVVYSKAIELERGPNQLRPRVPILPAGAYFFRVSVGHSLGTGKIMIH